MRVALFYSISGLLMQQEQTKKSEMKASRALVDKRYLPMGFQMRGLWGHFNFTIAPFSHSYNKYQWFGGGWGHNRKVEMSKKDSNLTPFLERSTLRLWPQLPPNHWYLLYGCENGAIVKLKWPHQPRV